MTAAWISYFDDGELKRVSARMLCDTLTHGDSLVKSEYAFVHSSCFGVQPDADRRPERQSAGACCVSGL